MITGPRVTLRPVAESDEGVFYEIAAEADTWEERTDRPMVPLTRAAYSEQFKDGLAAGDAQFAIEVDGTVVGGCALFHLDQLARRGEVGIELSATARGKGYGTESLDLLAGYAFQRRNLHRIHLRALATNEAALAAYRRVGFRAEGVLRDSAWVRGEYVDEVVMGLLQHEWRARPTGS